MDRRATGLSGWLCIGALLVGTALASGAAVPVDLPDAVAKAVKAAFPKAVISGVELENEGGVTLYVVRLDHGDLTVDIEVAADGVIGEVETEMGIEDVPDYVAAAVREATGGGTIALIEKHELHGRVRDGRLVKVKEPMVLYEVKFILEGKRRIVEIADTPALKLPSPARAAVAAAFPGAVVTKVEEEHEYGLSLYEAELKADGKELEVTVSPDGIIVEVEMSVKAADLPEAVAAAIAGVAKGARILEYEKEEVRAVPKLTALDEPEVIYEAKFVKDGKQYEVEVAADGTVIEVEEEEEDDEDD